MEITNLLKQKSNNQESPEVFLAVQIQEGLVKTALWQITAGNPQILSFGSLQNYADSTTLPESIDVSISHALANVENEPNRVILGVPESWFKNDQISPEHKDIITNVTTQLDLKPVGLVSLTDAVITHLKEKEGIPPSIILVEVSDTKVNVVVIRLGQVKGREEVDRSDDLAADVAEGLARIDIDQLPSRIFIINGNDSELEQQLISYPWMDKFPFLHLPKVEVPDPHFSIEAIALCGGGEAARSLGLEIAPVKVDHSTQPETPSSEPVVQTSKLAEGFHIDQEVPPAPSTPPPIQEASLPTIEPKTSFALPKIKIPKFKIGKPSLSFLPSFPSIKLPKNNVFLLIPLLLVLLVAGVYALFLFVLNSVKINLKLNPYPLSKSVTVAIADKPYDTLPTLKATPQTYEIEKSGEKETTGEAIVGDKATGEVVVFNKTDSPKTLAKGTLLSTTDNLKFYIDSEVEIASRSSTPTPDGSGTNITFGKTNVKVTAAKIGPDSNLSSNTSLSVASFPLASLEAKVSSELTGGTARTVRAVSDTDQKKLLEEVLDQVKQEAADKVAQSSSQQAIPTSDIKVVKQTFNKGIDEEAQNLTLTIKATITVLQYAPEELRLLLASNLIGEIPTGYKFDANMVDITFENVSEDKNGQITATAIVEGNLMPDLDLASYQEQIKGKSVLSARQLLESVVGYQEVEFILSSRLPLMADRLPYDPRKISIVVTPAL